MDRKWQHTKYVCSMPQYIPRYLGEVDTQLSTYLA